MKPGPNPKPQTPNLQVRADFAQLEAEHNEKKAVYDNTKVGPDGNAKPQTRRWG